MIFLIEYDRRRGRLVKLRRYDDSNRKAAEDERLTLELQLNRARLEREVVLLEAASEDALRRTHRRYFENVTELATKEPSDA